MSSRLAGSRLTGSGVIALIAAQNAPRNPLEGLRRTNRGWPSVCLWNLLESAEGAGLWRAEERRAQKVRV